MKLKVVFRSVTFHSTFDVGLLIVIHFSHVKIYLIRFHRPRYNIAMIGVLVWHSIICVLSFSTDGNHHLTSSHCLPVKSTQLFRLFCLALSIVSFRSSAHLSSTLIAAMPSHMLSLTYTFKRASAMQTVAYEMISPWQTDKSNTTCGAQLLWLQLPTRALGTVLIEQLQKGRHFVLLCSTKKRIDRTVFTLC